MSVTSVTRDMTSAELARVTEITAIRHFEVATHEGRIAIVTYDANDDTLYCDTHNDVNNCTCTARVRLCGILSNTVSKPMKVVRFDIAEMAREHEAANAAKENR